MRLWLRLEYALYCLWINPQTCLSKYFYRAIVFLTITYNPSVNKLRYMGATCKRRPPATSDLSIYFQTNAKICTQRPHNYRPTTTQWLACGTTTSNPHSSGCFAAAILAYKTGYLVISLAFFLSSGRPFLPHLLYLIGSFATRHLSQAPDQRTTPNGSATVHTRS